MLHIETEQEYIRVVEQFSDMIFRIAYQNLYHTSDAEDVVQDVFVKLLRQKGKCFKDYEHLKSWLIRVTINQCLDYKKSFFRKNTVPLEDITYATQEGAFQVSNPKGKSIVVDGEKVEKELNVPGSAHENIRKKNLL